ncbi:hypothetical protein [Sulfitobacter sp. JB4-11]|uniref:hypothetical protein n=1 Tax=Sulfitobacter rhodophyticola TaxID=3238304 RepID=UPI003514A212
MKHPLILALAVSLWGTLSAWAQTPLDPATAARLLGVGDVDVLVQRIPEPAPRWQVVAASDRAPLGQIGSTGRCCAAPGIPASRWTSLSAWTR